MTRLRVNRGNKLESIEESVSTKLHHLIIAAHHLPLNLSHLFTDIAGQSLWVRSLAQIDMLIFFETTPVAKVLELALVTYGGQEAFTSTDVLLTVAANLQPLLVVLQANVGAELFDIRAESDTIFAQTGCNNLLPAA